MNFFMPFVRIKLLREVPEIASIHIFVDLFEPTKINSQTNADKVALCEINCTIVS